MATQDLENATTLGLLVAVIFTQQSGEQAGKITGHLRRHAARLLNYGCHVAVRLAPNRDERDIAPTLANSSLPRSGLGAEDPAPNVRILAEAQSWNDLANYVLERPVEPIASAQALAIDDRTKTLNEDQKILIRRAFHDCTEVHFMDMDDQGRSGVKVFKAFPERATVVGRWPTPYFVKIGTREKILKEYENYELRVDPLLPFYLGPHLVQSRCFLGGLYGILVGDYVDESESLLAAARDGRAAPAIACLFDRTLLGWHRTAERREVTLAKELARAFPTEIPAARVQRAKALGAACDLAQLRALFDKSPGPVLVGLVHGDLHASNVRVRATDAIVIDFFAHRESPLVYDAATLEASLLVDGFPQEARSIGEWLDSLRPLYNCRLEEPPKHCPPKDLSAWFYMCAHQIRRYARAWDCSGTGRQYAAALAVALLRKALRDENAPEPQKSRRAAAYVVAEWLLLSNFGN